MADSPLSISAAPQTSSESADLLLRETNHRCSNDLQLVVSLLALQSRRTANPEVRDALADAMERVAILARARNAMHGERAATVSTALRQVCEALHAQAEPRGIDVTFTAGDEVGGLLPNQITTVALVVNELATNAIKHAFEEGKSGHVSVSISANERGITIIVDDDGLPFPEIEGNVTGMGIGLIQRLMASIGGLFILPPPGTKLFGLRIPCG